MLSQSYKQKTKIDGNCLAVKYISVWRADNESNNGDDDGDDWRKKAL